MPTINSNVIIPKTTIVPDGRDWAVSSDSTANESGEPIKGKFEGEPRSLEMVNGIAVCEAGVVMPGGGAAMPDSFLIGKAAVSRVKLVSLGPRALNLTSATAPFAICGAVLAKEASTKPPSCGSNNPFMPEIGLAALTG